MSQTRILSAEELEKRRKQLAGERTHRARVLICMTGCRALGAIEVFNAFREQVAAAGLANEVAIVATGCHGLCARAPVVLIEPQEYLYCAVRPEDIEEIIQTTLRAGKAVRRLCFTANGRVIPKLGNIPFYKNQQRRVLQNCGRIAPKRIEDAVARGAYGAAAKALCSMTPEDVIEEVREAGLRGRGGAGFPTGVKWGFCRKAPGDEKYLICNADEGDPGAFMDRALLEGDPHRVIEGMLIAAHAIVAMRGFVYVRAEYPIAVEHINIALEQAREWGLLGENILGSGFDFDIEVREGAGAFVCGEETALIASLEGRRGMPRPRPPFPANKGYHDKPTNINNVETLANVPLIILKGKDWYRSIGTEGSKGTKIFALAGKVNNTGLVEVPMGATLRQIIFDIGGGIPKGRKFKAAQMGGPSGGCVPPRYLDLAIDYDSVKEIGAIMGSGGLIVMDENTCMVDIARYFLEFVQNESCGKCTPCRVGTRHMLDILTRITRGEGRMQDLDKLERLARMVQEASLCGLGQTGPNPVLSTLRYFRDEYEEHIKLKFCRAGVCEALVRSPCSHACPAGVNVPEYLALIAEDKIEEAVNVIRRRNPFVSVCGRVCDHPCERRCRRGEVDEPLAIRALKRYAADRAKTYDEPLVPPAKGDPQVAVIGSGPAGLACAYFLAVLGQPSIVLEEQCIPGGMLALGIPEYRLPKTVLKREIDFILSHGVQLKTGQRIEDAQELLKQGYRAVFVATGAQKGASLRIEGENLDGVSDALDFLRARALGNGSVQGRIVTVIGGGNAAVDAARSALRMGAEKVTILYRRSREEMPAYQEEIEHALKEGIELVTLVSPVRILGDNGKVGKVELTRMKLGGADESGRRRPLPIPGSEFTVGCDMLLTAIGQLPTYEPLRLSEDEKPEVDPLTQATKVEGIYAGGDCVTGGATVIEAIGAGQRAACAIDRFLGGSGILPPDSGMTYTKPTEEELEASPPRARERMVAARKRRASFCEVVKSLGKKAALAEARRCLRCDLEQGED